MNHLNPFKKHKNLPSVSELRLKIAKGFISCEEVLADHQVRIAAFNPQLNALPTLCMERALREAKRLDKAIHASRARSSTPRFGPLAGIPYCAKDIFDTEGVRTTLGSPLFSGQVPTKDAEIVRRIRSAGAVMVGKSNTPEFAAGSQTFNTVFGATRNPWHPERTCGGSTGGGAVALATGMVSLADGSDLAASLRNPASFCGITGLRPSSHLEPRLQSGANPFNTLSMVGPMGRTVADTRELFLAIVDPQGCAPKVSLSEWVRLRDHQAKTGLQARAGKRLRMGWAPNWGNLPVQHEVSKAMEICAEQLRTQGITLVEGFPKLPDVRKAFLTLRGAYFVAEFSDLYARHRSSLKDTVIWNIEQGLALTAADIAQAEKIRAEARTIIENHMDAHNLDAIAGPTNQVLPFDLNTPYVTHINGQALETYIDWLASNFMITVAGLPAVSIPAGFADDPQTATPLPVGLQLVGRWGDDTALLDDAERIEAALHTLTQAAALPEAQSA